MSRVTHSGLLKCCGWKGIFLITELEGLKNFCICSLKLCPERVWQTEVWRGKTSTLDRIKLFTTLSYDSRKKKNISGLKDCASHSEEFLIFCVLVFFHCYGNVPWNWDIVTARLLSTSWQLIYASLSFWGLECFWSKHSNSTYCMPLRQDRI